MLTTDEVVKVSMEWHYRREGRPLQITAADVGEAGGTLVSSKKEMTVREPLFVGWLARMRRRRRDRNDGDSEGLCSSEWFARLV